MNALTPFKEILTRRVGSLPGDYAVVARNHWQAMQLYHHIKAKAIELDRLERATANHLWIKGGYHLIFCAQSTYINTVERIRGSKLKGYLLAEEDEGLEAFLNSRIR